MTDWRTTVVVPALVAFVALVPRTAGADKPGSFSIDRFDPTPPGDRFESVNGGGVEGEELFRAGFTLNYAKEPLVVRSTPPIVLHQLVLHANLSLSLWERVLLSGALPVVLVNHGDRVERPGNPPVALAAANSASVGDLLLGARVYLLAMPHKLADLAVGGSFWLPTGQPAEFTGDPNPRAMPYASVSGAIPHLVYASHVGVMIQRSQDFVDVHLGPELRFGVAAAVVSSGDRVQVGPELTASAPFGNGAGDAHGLWSVELLGSVRVRIADVVLGAALGPGLARGVGTPSFRSIATVAFAPTGEKNADRDGIIDSADACPNVKGAPNEDRELNGCPPDWDADGVLDAVDRCPYEPGVRSKDPRRDGCPVPTDRDGDGTPDKTDACPDHAAPANPDPKKNGCPPDRDGDGIVDAEDACLDKAGVDDADLGKKGCPVDSDGDGIAVGEDACPTAAGAPSNVAARNGCPHDGDGDAIDDRADACPRERGPANAIPAKNGCPVTVRFGAEGIELLQAIPFAQGSDAISKAAESVLQEVASVLADHPEVLRLAVEAAPGIEARRAAAVARWLANHGVARARLEVRRVESARGLTLRVVDPTRASPP